MDHVTEDWGNDEIQLRHHRDKLRFKIEKLFCLIKKCSLGEQKRLLSKFQTLDQ